jgi:hypothetical protein
MPSWGSHSPQTAALASDFGYFAEKWQLNTVKIRIYCTKNRYYATNSQN